MKLNRVYLGVAVLCFFVTSFAGDAYRAWAWGNGVNDLGLADAWTNIWGMPTALFLWSGIGWVRSRSSRRRAVLGALLGFIIYELLQLLLQRGTCDFRDMVGSAVGALIALVMFSALDRVGSRTVNSSHSSTV